MPFFDLSLPELENYVPERSEPADFDTFWTNTLSEARWHPLDAKFEPVDVGLRLVDVYDVTFNGYAGQPVKGWFIKPRGVTEPLPCLVEYVGYGGGRGAPTESLVWAAAGYAHLVMDTRGQGSAWRRGDTPDVPDGANPFYPGFMTQGILDPTTYYYRRVFTDAVRAVEAALSRNDVDSERVAVAGKSQGGGITIAVAGLMTDQIKLCLPDVPFLCHYRRAVGKTDRNPYHEIVQYLSIHREKEDTIFNTLDYFDGVNMAARITAECLFSVGEMDETCPPSTVYAAYNQISAPRHIEVYRFNDHEGGGPDHVLRQIAFVNERWG